MDMKKKFQAQIAGCIAGLFEAFTNWQIQVYREKPLDLTQKAAVGTNLQFATQVFLPKVIHQLEKQCRTKLVSFVPVREKLDAIVREAGLSIGSGSAQLSRSTSRAGLASGTGTPSRRPSAATGLLHASSSISSGGGIAADPAAAASTNSPTTATGSRNRLSSMTGSLERRPSTASASGRLSPLAAASASPSVRNSSSSVAGEDGARRGSAGSHASSSSAAAAGIVAESAGRPRRPTRDGSQPELRARSRSPGGPGVGGAAAADGIRRTSAWQSTPALSSSSTTPPPPGNLSPPNASGGGSPASARRGVSPGPGSGRRSRSPAGSMPRLNTATDSTGPLLDLSARLAAGSMDLDAQWPGTLAAHMQPTVGMRRLVGAAQTDGSVADRVLVSAAASAAATSPAGRSGGSVSVVAATQVVLDIHYLLNAVNVSDAAAAAGQELCEKALRAYLVAGGDPTRLMGGDWYEQRVSDALARESSGR
ncbi:hypothetical protein BC828DRAFT_42789 [Blastocladiella britannica]|nr:hypothetical protein BC828DRAFT_42789 [Blastocladiella britannica]